MAEKERERRALVLVGHGSEAHSEAAHSVEALADVLRARRVFAEVRPAFLKARPFLADVLDTLAGQTTYVVPHLAADGVVGGEALPRALVDRPGIVVCKATGTHPGVSEIAASRLDALRAAFALDPTRLGVLVAAHGTPRNPDSAARARGLAETLKSLGACAESAAAFIDEPPAIAEWDRLLAAPDIAVVPLLMAEGRHGGNDVSSMLGIEPAQSSEPFAGPFARQGRRLWLLKALGTDPAFAEIVLARVAEADG